MTFVLIFALATVALFFLAIPLLAFALMLETVQTERLLSASEPVDALDHAAYPREAALA